jgi:hypothetical protein
MILNGLDAPAVGANLDCLLEIAMDTQEHGKADANHE